MPINAALAHLYGAPPDAPEPEPEPAAAPTAAKNEQPAAAPPAKADPSRLEQNALLVEMTLQPPPSVQDFAKLLPGRPRRELESLLAELRRNEGQLIMEHLGNATGWDPRWFHDEPIGEVHIYKDKLMLAPETYYPGAESQIPRLLALDKISHYQDAFSKTLEARIALREKLLAAYRALARPPDPEWEARIRGIGAVYQMTPLQQPETAIAAPGAAAEAPTASPYYAKMEKRHAELARQALHPQKNKQEQR